MENKKPNIQRVARNMILHFRSLEKTGKQEEIDHLWNLIEKRAITEKRRKQRRLYLFASSAAAITLLCVFWLGKQFVSDYKEDNSIAEFAQQTQAISSDNGEIRLLMPGEKEIGVGTRDANIVYSQNGTVIVNSDTVNQTEIKKEEAEFNQLIIPKGKRTQLTLSDGTRLWANSGTRVIYPSHFEKDHREIYVEGEVYLDVFHNERAPFIVRTHDFQIQVLGTKFNVSAYLSEKTSSVVLVEGSVNVKNQKKEQVKMAPGQLVNIRTGQLAPPQNVDTEPYVCWMKNMLIYKNEPLDNVFHKLNLYYGKDFILETGIEMMQVTGKLDLKEQLEDVLHTISFSAPICYEELNGKVYVRKNK